MKCFQTTMKSAKAAIDGAVKTLGEWARAQEVQAAPHLDSFVEKWKDFENEMQSVRSTRNGPLRWTAPPNRNPDEGVAILPQQVQSATQNLNNGKAQSSNLVKSTTQASSAQPLVQTVKTPTMENKPKVVDITPNTEEGRAELAMYLKTHHKEVENQREVLRKRLDRIASQDLPRLEKHLMVNPQKLFTPAKKMKFGNVAKANSKVADTRTVEDEQKRDSLNDMSATENLPQSQPAFEEPTKTTITKLAALTKSAEASKTATPQNLLKVLMSKSSTQFPSQARQGEPSRPTSASFETSPNQAPLPSLIEHLQSASAQVDSKAVSPYPPVPYATKYYLPTPSSQPYVLPKSRKKIQKAPMSFVSPLTSIERRMDMSLSQASSYSVALN